MWADGQTRQTLTVAFRCFLNVPHKHALPKAIRYPQRNRDSVVGVVTRPRVRWSMVRITEGAKVSFFSKIIHISSAVYPASYPLCTGVLSWEQSGVLSRPFAFIWNRS